MQKVYCIDEDGISGLWDDDICIGLGAATIRRASDVEPTEDGKWIVKFHHLGGYLTEDRSGNGDYTRSRRRAKEFARRGDAIDAEIKFLNDEILRGVKL